MPKNRIQLAIHNNRIKFLATLDIEELISFSDKKNNLNAFLFACLENCEYKIINLIIDRALDYFCKKIKNSEEYKNSDIEADEVIDIAENCQAGKEYFEFFYGTFEVNKMKLNAAALVLRNNNTEAARLIFDKLFLSPVHDEFLPPKKERKEVFDLLTKKYGKSQGAYFSSELPNIERQPRQFKKERERQLLKQLSTVLFFYIKANRSKKLTEIEILHLHIENVSHLIISCNGGDDLGESFKEVSTMKDLHAKLIGDIKVNRDIEGSFRVKRYQEIFKSIFSTKGEIGYGYLDNNGEDKNDIEKYDNIIKILQDEEISIRCINNYPNKRKEKDVAKDIRAILNAENSTIIVLDNKGTTKEHGLHAEEYLIDFLKLIIFYSNQDKMNKNLYSGIAGKKRPCFTCYTTMFNFKGITLNHGERPGYVWKSAFNLQERNTPNNSKMTLLNISGKSSNVTVAKNGKLKSGYDSGSDDEEIKNEEHYYIRKIFVYPQYK